MKKLNLQVLFITLGMFFLFSNYSYSQSRPIASGGIFVNNNTVEVRVRVDSAINTWGYVSGVMFTIKCPDNALTAFLGSANINFISNPYGFGAPTVTTNGGFKYLTFTATPSMGGTLTWPANTDYQIVTFNISGGAGTANFDLTNDNPPNFPWYFEVAAEDLRAAALRHKYDLEKIDRRVEGNVYLGVEEAHVRARVLSRDRVDDRRPEVRFSRLVGDHLPEDPFEHGKALLGLDVVAASHVEKRPARVAADEPLLLLGVLPFFEERFHRTFRERVVLSRDTLADALLHIFRDRAGTFFDDPRCHFIEKRLSHQKLFH